jgi:hypothetical protein
VSKQRASFGKRQREKDRQEKAAAKRDRRATRTGEEEDSSGAELSGEDEAKILAALAALHEAYDAERMDLDEFESARDALLARLTGA